MNIYYFEDSRGHVPVKDFIDGLTLEDRAKVFAYLEELKRQGHNLRRPMADYVCDGIYELRPKANRIFYFFYLREHVVLVHAIRKKTYKIPDNDIVLRIKRKKLIDQNRSIIFQGK